MIVLFHPRSTRPKNRRLPLSVLHLAAVLEGREEYTIVDGNVDPDPSSTLDALAGSHSIELLAVSVMPGPQLRAAVPVCRAFREKYPRIPIVWGGYFPSLYTAAALNARYVDFVVKGQGEDALLELIEVLRGGSDFSRVRGLAFKDAFGLPVHTPERPLKSPDEFPWLPYHRLDPSKYLAHTFLGSRTTVHQASIGCPFRCNFCGVVPVYDREKMESPARTAAILNHLQRTYGVNAVQFYDNNFFLREEHAKELAARIAPLNLHWWCEARVDIVLRYSDATLRQLRRAGCVMIFFGVESGADAALEGMNKQLTAEQTLALAARIRQFGIVPEYSLIFGNPADPERDLAENIAFVRRVKRVNPDVEIVVQTYVPTPQRGATFGDAVIEFPSTPDEWIMDPWYRLLIRTDPQLPWLSPRVKRRIRDFETVMNARWPTTQDVRLPAWGRALLKALSSWRYALSAYDFPAELRLAQKLVRLRQPRLESL
ncbi:MAG: B12-binding domain-containing radical SAM protein [Terriglobia bacterium]|nr:MAG: B12-binding domain-containing radical SAM protein [Terriglobia bacterium]